MRNAESILESLELKIVNVLAHLDALKAENQRLKLESAAQKEKAEAQRAALDKKEADLEALRIASSMLGSNDDKRASKLKINALIRDINDCLASLSD
jgi:chromosome segregation ATPase